MDAINPMKAVKVGETVCFYMVNGIKIIGTMHLPPNTRMTETLNAQFAQKIFIPVTDVKIFEPGGGEKTSSFLVVNKNQILFCFPLKQEA